MALATKKRKVTVASKKRQGHHHSHSKAYIRPYWPYLPMLLILFVGFLLNSVWSRTAVLSGQSDYSSASLLEATNQERTSNDEEPLTLDAQLATAAQAKANDMVTKNYWAHVAPDGTTPWTFISSAGYQYRAAGENLAYGFADADAVVTGWMNSPSHRANVLGAAFKNVGFGVAQATDFQGQGPVTVVVAEYGQPLGISLTANVPATPENTPAAAAPTNTNDAKKVSRIQLLTGGQAAWASLVLAALAGAGLCWLVLRNGYKLHRALSQGEAFVVHHPYADIAIVAVVTAGFLLTHTAGLIH